jgi:acyl-CoA reductase-like NAD-dependent aldehyde dehydrogenase
MSDRNHEYQLAEAASEFSASLREWRQARSEFRELTKLVSKDTSDINELQIAAARAGVEFYEVDTFRALRRNALARKVEAAKLPQSKKCLENFQTQRRILVEKFGKAISENERDLFAAEISAIEAPLAQAKQDIASAEVAHACFEAARELGLV